MITFTCTVYDFPSFGPGKLYFPWYFFRKPAVQCLQALCRGSALRHLAAAIIRSERAPLIFWHPPVKNAQCGRMGSVLCWHPLVKKSHPCTAEGLACPDRRGSVGTQFAPQDARVLCPRLLSQVAFVAALHHPHGWRHRLKAKQHGWGATPLGFAKRKGYRQSRRTPGVWGRRLCDFDH